MIDYDIYSTRNRQHLEYLSSRNRYLEMKMRAIRNLLNQNQNILNNIQNSGLMREPRSERPYSLRDAVLDEALGYRIGGIHGEEFQNSRHADVDIASLYPPYMRNPLADREREVTPRYRTCSYPIGGVHGKETLNESSANTNDYDMI